MRLLEWVLDSSIYQMVNIDEMQFTFVPGRGTTDAIFIVPQLQEKYITAASKRLCFAFVDLEKAFDHMPRKVLQWALRNLGVEEWAVRVIQGYVPSRVCMPGAMCRSMVNTMRSLTWELVCIRALPLTHCSSSWCWKGYRASWCAAGASLCWWPGAHHRNSVGVYFQTQGMEGWHGK